nr:MAG TPA: hypothetical protein [Caudoviricetes sp.]
MGIGQNFRFLTFNGYVSQHLRTATPTLPNRPLLA